MRAIFLDIDGVLNCESMPNPRHFPYIVDQKLLARFHKLVEVSGAQVVLTSSWRVDPIGLYAARYYKVPFDDICPDIPDAPRCTEILRWLKTHANHHSHSRLGCDERLEVGKRTKDQKATPTAPAPLGS